MDFDIQSNLTDRKTDLLWLIQQSLDGDLHAIEILIGTIAPKYFPVSDLFALTKNQLDEFAREGLIFLLWHLKEFNEVDNFDTWWIKVFFRYLREMRAEIQNFNIGIPGLAHLDEKLIDEYLLRGSDIFTDEEIASVLENSFLGSEFDSHKNENPQKFDEIVLDDHAHAEILEYISQRKLQPGPENDLRQHQIIQDARKIFLQRREKVRKRLVLFQLIWGFLGIAFLAGAFQFAGNIFTSGDSINQADTVANEATSGTTNVADPDPLATPTSTPKPYERTQANGTSYSPDISADGRWIVYSSEATNLVQGDTNGYADIFLYDRLSKETVRITELTDGRQTDGPSFGPSISPDGGWISFVSFATNLVPTEKPNCAHSQSAPRPCADVFLYDRDSDSFSLVSQINDVPGNNDSGLSPQSDIFAAKTAISDTGQHVAFFSRATNLGADLIYGGLFVYSRENSNLFRVDITYNDTDVDGSSYWPTFSADGDLLGFQSEATNLVPNDLNGLSDIYVYSIRSTDLVRVTTGVSDTGAGGSSVMPDFSSQGTSMIFRSNAEGLVDIQTHGIDQIYVHDLVVGETKMITLGDTGAGANGPSNLPSISADGNTAAFISLAQDLDDSLFNGTWDVYASNLLTGDIQLLTRGLSGQAADGPSSFPKLSGDGFLVVFLSAASNLVPGDENGVSDIFLFQRESATIQRINIP